jgi:hypothetical protein
MAETGQEGIIETDYGHVLRYPDAGLSQGPQHPDGHLVVRRHNRIRKILARQRDQAFGGRLAATHVEESLVRADQPGGRVSA